MNNALNITPQSTRFQQLDEVPDKRLRYNTIRPKFKKAGHLPYR